MTWKPFFSFGHGEKFILLCHGQKITSKAAVLTVEADFE